MVVVERFTAAQLQLRSPVLLATPESKDAVHNRDACTGRLDSLRVRT